MKKILKYKNYEDWTGHVKNMVSPGWYKTNKRLNFLLNIAIPAILLFVLKVNIFVFLLAFIAVDIGMIALDYSSVGMYGAIRKLTWQLQKGKFKQKVGQMSLKEMNQLKESINSNAEFSKEKLSVLNEQISEYKKLENASMPIHHRDTIKYVSEMIDRMRAYSDNEDSIDWICREISKTVKKSDKLLEIVHDDTDSIVQIVNTYNVYAEEMMSIILKYQEADKEQKENIKPKLQKLLDAFNEKLDRLETKISSSKEKSLDFDIDYLTRKLEEDDKDDNN